MMIRVETESEIHQRLGRRPTVDYIELELDESDGEAPAIASVSVVAVRPHLQVLARSGGRPLSRGVLVYQIVVVVVVPGGVAVGGNRSPRTKVLVAREDLDII